MTFQRNIGFLLLAIYLIIIGITALVPGIELPGIMTSLLALISGIFILLGR